MAVELATGYVSILPSAAGFGPKLAQELQGIGVQVGAPLGDDVALGLAEGLKRNGAKVANAGKALSLGVTVPLAAIGAAAVSAEADFSKSMNLLQAATGAPTEKMDKLRNLAKQLGKDTVFSAGEAADAMLELAKGGMSVAQIKAGGVEAAMTLAAAGEIEVADAAKVTMAAMNTFGLKAQDASEITDALAGVANASAADIDDLAQGLAMAGQAAASSGLSVEETTAALAAFSNAGLSGSDAGTSFKQMLIALNPKSDEAAELMGQLGLDFFDAQGNMKPLTGIASELQAGFKGLSTEERNAAMQTIFGSDASRAANILRKEGVKGITDLIAKTSEQGAAQKMADAAMKGTAGALEQLKGSLETAALAVGEALAPVVQDLAGKIRGLADWFTNLNPSMQQTIVKIGLAAAAVGPLLFVFGKLGQGLGVIISLVTSAPAKWLAMKAAMVAVKVATAAWTAAQWLLNAALNANPIGLIIIAVAALAAAIIWLWNNNEDFRNFVIAAWEKIREVVSTVVDWFKANVAPVLAAIWEKVSKALGILWNVYKAVWGKIFSVVWDVVKWLAEKAWPIISWVFEKIADGVKITFTIMKRVWDGIYKVIEPVVDWIKNTVAPWIEDSWEAIQIAAKIMHDQLVDLWKSIEDKVGPIITWIAEHGAYQFKVMKEALSTIWTAVSDGISTAWETISDTVSTGVGGVITTVKTIGDVVATVVGYFTSIKDGISDKFGAAITFITEVPGKILTAIGDVASTLYNKGQNFIGGLIDGVRDRFFGGSDNDEDGVAGWFKSLPGKVFNKIGDVTSTLAEKGRNFLGGLIDGLRARFFGTGDSDEDGVAGWFNTLPGKVFNKIGNVASTLYDKGKDLVWGLFQGIKEFFAGKDDNDEDGVAGWFWKLSQRVFNKIGDVSRALVQKGRDLISGLLVGIVEKAKELAAGAKKAAQVVLAALKSVFQFGSPSKVTTEMGRQIGAGLAVGLDKSRDEVRAAALTLSNTVADTIAATDATITAGSTTTTAGGVAGYRPGMTTATINPNAYSGGPSNTFTITAAPTVPTEQQILTALARAEALQP